MKVKFKIGDRIQLNHLSSVLGHVRSENTYISQVLDFDEIRTVKISMPIFEGRLIPLEVGDEYYLCFFTDAGLYRCRGRIKARYEENKIFIAEITMISELKKFQRRQFFRLDCVVEFEYRIVSHEEEVVRERIAQKKFDSPEEEKKYWEYLDKVPKDWKEATISDLSGGGIRFHCSSEIESGTLLETMIPLVFSNGVVPSKFMVKVLSCYKYESMSNTYEIRCEFSGITDTERELIVQYVFEQQRRRLKKE